MASILRLLRAARPAGAQTRLAERELADVQRRYRTLVEQLPLASYIEGLDAASAGYMSPQIAELVGYTAAEWTSDPGFFGKVLHPDDRDRVLAGFEWMHRTGEPFECEYRLIASDGREVWIHDAAVVVQDEEGRPLWAQGYLLDITARKESEAALRENRAQLEHLALHDSLTGLPNRTLMHDRLHEALARSGRRGESVALMLLDVDDFKLVNDSLGHGAGDTVLVELAHRLRSTIRDGDTVARLGGDEFAVVAEGMSGKADIAALADRVLSAFDEPFAIGDGHHELRGSLGVAYSVKGDSEELMRDADVAMYRAKAAGKGGFEIFDGGFRQEFLRRVALSNALKDALRTDELTVFYQPIVSLADGDVLAVEALVRWEHPQWGWVQPSEFVPLAEDDGTIVELGAYVRSRAVQAGARWKAELPGALPLGVFLNVSGRELAHPGFADRFAATLAEHSLSTAEVAVEMTERVFIDDRNLTVRRNLSELAQLGVRLILDDFGTGYSALASLKRFPLAALKIDRYFIRSIHEVDELPVTKAIVSLGQTLGMTVIAEGIETKVQLDRLRGLGCEAGQGYYFARPEPEAAVSARLTAPAPAAAIPLHRPRAVGFR